MIAGQTTLEHSLASLGHFGETAAAAAFCLARVGATKQAVEVVESGRARTLADALDDRQLELAAEHDPELAALLVRYGRAREAVGAARTLTPPSA